MSDECDDGYQFEVPDFTSIEHQTFDYVHYKQISGYDSLYMQGK